MHFLSVHKLIKYFWDKHSGALSYRPQANKIHLEETFNNYIIEHGDTIEWLYLFVDLSLIGFFSYGYLKE